MKQINELAPSDILYGPYQNEPLVYEAINYWMKGVCTWEQSLIQIILSLIESNESYKTIAEKNINNRVEAFGS